MYVTRLFGKWKIVFKNEILHFNINFKAQINFFTKPALKHRFYIRNGDILILKNKAFLDGVRLP